MIYRPDYTFVGEKSSQKLYGESKKEQNDLSRRVGSMAGDNFLESSCTLGAARQTRPIWWRNKICTLLLNKFDRCLRLSASPECESMA